MSVSSNEKGRDSLVLRVLCVSLGSEEEHIYLDHLRVGPREVGLVRVSSAPRSFARSFARSHPTCSTRRERNQVVPLNLMT